MSEEHNNYWSRVTYDFSLYLKLERSFSENTINSYKSDIIQLFDFCSSKDIHSVTNISQEILEEYLVDIQSNSISKRSQARKISSIKALFHFLEIEGIIKVNPCDKIDTPKISRNIPDVLSLEEVEKILHSIDLSKPFGHRNRAMIETLYSCGLRVSELINLKISNLYLKDGFIKVEGKGSKQRLVPIGEIAINQIVNYYNIRKKGKVSKEAEDILFLNRSGKKLTREMVFIIIKSLAQEAGIEKNISPHTFRHSFASHLIENGADLRAVQEMLGHESILTTEIYTHIDQSKWQNTILKFHPQRELE